MTKIVNCFGKCFIFFKGRNQADIKLLRILTTIVVFKGNVLKLFRKPRGEKVVS